MTNKIKRGQVFSGEKTCCVEYESANPRQAALKYIAFTIKFRNALIQLEL